MAADRAVEDVGEVGDVADGVRKDCPGSRKECTTSLTGMGTICFLYVPDARRSGRMVVKEIGFPFVASTGAGRRETKNREGCISSCLTPPQPPRPAPFTPPVEVCW